MNIRNKSLFRSSRDLGKETIERSAVGEEVLVGEDSDSAATTLELEHSLPLVGSQPPREEARPEVRIADSTAIESMDTSVFTSHPAQAEAQSVPVGPQPAGQSERESAQLAARCSEFEGASTIAFPSDGKLYQQCCGFVSVSVARAGQDELPDLELADSLVHQMMGSLEVGTELLLMATERTQKFDVSTHCVNVATFALHMAPALAYTAEMQKRAGLAGLLHEVGVASLPPELLNKREALTTQEMELLRQRPVVSARILQGLGPGYEWLAQAVGQVYEREDGSGLPLGLAGSAIREEAKIIGLADLFEACIHDRPYRRAITGYQSVLELTSKGAHLFPDRIIKALLKSFSLFPHNEFVRLNTGEIAKVVEVNRDNLFRPVVQVVYQQNGEPVADLRVVDLSQASSLYVTEAITQETLNQQVVY